MKGCQGRLFLFSHQKGAIKYVPFFFSEGYFWDVVVGVRRPAFLVLRQVTYPLGGTDQYEDQSKDILNSILKEELSDSDTEALIEELWAVKQQLTLT